MKIIYEDKDQIVIHKSAGVATQTARLGEKDLVSEVKNHIAKEEGKQNPFVGVINRLDQPVEGIVLFAKNAKENFYNLLIFSASLFLHFCIWQNICYKMPQGLGGAEKYNQPCIEVLSTSLS